MSLVLQPNLSPYVAFDSEYIVLSTASRIVAHHLLYLIAYKTKRSTVCQMLAILLEAMLLSKEFLEI